jgi:hypothetical protein
MIFSQREGWETQLSPTFECFEIGSTLFVCADTMHTTSFPVTPTGNVPQPLVVGPIFEILGADKTIST